MKVEHLPEDKRGANSLDKDKVANEWQEQVTGLCLEIENENYSMIDAQAPSSPT